MFLFTVNPLHTLEVLPKTASSNPKIEEIELFFAKRKKGDINEDGKVNSEDLKLLKEHLNGEKELSEEQLQYADLNDDGKVDLNDYRFFVYALTEKNHLEDRINELQVLYTALKAKDKPSNVVRGVNNSNIESVESELDITKTRLLYINSFLS